MMSTHQILPPSLSNWHTFVWHTLEYHHRYVPATIALLKLDLKEWWLNTWVAKQLAKTSANAFAAASQATARAAAARGAATSGALGSSPSAAAIAASGTLHAVDRAGKQISEGQVVHANWRGGQQLFPGYVHTVHADGTIDIQYDDGDFELEVDARRFVTRVEGAKVSLFLFLFLFCLLLTFRANPPHNLTRSPSHVIGLNHNARSWLQSSA